MIYQIFLNIFFAQRAFEAAFFDMYVPHSANPAFGQLLKRSEVLLARVHFYKPNPGAAADF